MKAAVVRETPNGYVDLIDDWTPRPLTFGEALVDVQDKIKLTDFCK